MDFGSRLACFCMKSSPGPATLAGPRRWTRAELAMEKKSLLDQERALG